MANEITEVWYETLINDCQAIITECEFTARWALVEGYHALGKRILEEYGNFEKRELYGREMTQRVAASLGKSQRTIEQSIQFAKKYPDLSQLPEGKNTSWHQICNKYLPNPKDKEVILPDGKYHVIYADPPWKYGNTMPEYFVEQGDHYKLLTVPEISALPIRELAEDNAVLFLWATSPILEEAFEVISSWGFLYKASFVWDKIKHNMGHYNSVRHEFLLLSTRGSCMPNTPKLFDSVISIERKKHSEKPEYFRTLIDTLYPNGKRIELFGRKQAEGWEVIGDQIPGF